MKKICFITLLLALVLAACGDRKQERMLSDMGKAIRHHIMINDVDNNLVTNIKYVTPISYEELSEGNKQDAKDAYSCRVYLVATSSYMNSSRIYNIDDTLTCYFDKDIKFLRWDKQETKGE